jgi:hypothetical protein
MIVVGAVSWDVTRVDLVRNHDLEERIASIIGELETTLAVTANMKLVACHFLSS